jgi:hypothetical protein
MEKNKFTIYSLTIERFNGMLKNAKKNAERVKSRRHLEEGKIDSLIYNECLVNISQID